MSEAMQLFPTGLARYTDPETSKDAARRIDPTKTRARILAAFAYLGPMTDDELCDALSVPPRRWPSVKTARSALSRCQQPLVEWTGEIRDGQRVWRLIARYRRTETVATNGRT